MAGDRRKIIYCSGPLFSPEEVETMAEISRLLEKQGFDTFLPHQDGLEAYVLNGVNNPLVNTLVFRPLVKLFSKGFFALDVYQVAARCDGFVFNMNGRVPDEGSVFKAAAAISAGKPVVIYKRDHRTAFFGSDNSMVAGLACTFKAVNSLDKLPRAIARAMHRCAPVRIEEPPPGLCRRGDMELGRAIWERLKQCPINLRKGDPVEQAVELVTYTAITG